MGQRKGTYSVQVFRPVMNGVTALAPAYIDFRYRYGEQEILNSNLVVQRAGRFLIWTCNNDENVASSKKHTQF